ncbi:hypothetical protein [Moorena sp. SIO3A2]|uniref:hypothetical protein n=1 Tax=Moorena sp. SIO3A2 TaxID=2607841 RepID=UPI0013BC5383|nr:hypothetical protein [Moorena sp. SIO3A2]NER90722.1 hypothetical protein [Moorena sp. SIO3A2]
MQRGLGEPVRPKGVPPMSNWRGFPHDRAASRQRNSISTDHRNICSRFSTPVDVQ